MSKKEEKSDAFQKRVFAAQLLSRVVINKAQEDERLGLRVIESRQARGGQEEVPEEELEEEGIEGEEEDLGLEDLGALEIVNEENETREEISAEKIENGDVSEDELGRTVD